MPVRPNSRRAYRTPTCPGGKCPGARSRSSMARSPRNAPGKEGPLHATRIPCRGVADTGTVDGAALVRARRPTDDLVSHLLTAGSTRTRTSGSSARSRTTSRRAIQVVCVDSIDGEASTPSPSPRRTGYAGTTSTTVTSPRVVPFRQRRGRRLTTLGASFGAYHAVTSVSATPTSWTRSWASPASTTSTRSWTATGTIATSIARRRTCRTWTRGREAVRDGHRDRDRRDRQHPHGHDEMIRILDAKGIRHRSPSGTRPYGHDWPWWRTQIRSYVP